MLKIREKRKASGQSVTTIASLLNVTTMAIYYYETGKRKISIEQLKCLAYFYDCDIKELI